MADRMLRVNQLVVEEKDADDLTPITFANLGFLRERDLRPWIENEREFLGDDLLVVQRAHTVVRRNRLRLDILAVARDGALVVIEVKLRDLDDDRDWRAFLHAAACGQRSADEIIELYAAFKGIDREKAAGCLKEHTGSAKLNHSQRVVLIARSFPKQVTTAALWLKEHGIDVSCIRLTPHLDEQTGACYVTRTELTPDSENLLVDLASTLGQRERDAAVMERQRERIDDFWASVCSNVQDRLDPELVPTRESTLVQGIYYLGFSYPWKSRGLYFFAYVLMAKEEPDRVRFTAVFQFNEPTVRWDGMSKPAIDRLWRLTATFAEKPGWNTRMGLEGYYEASKTVEVTLDGEGAERGGETLSEVIKKLYPGIERAVGKKFAREGAR